MAFIKIRIHAVWGTKNLKPLLSHPVRAILFQHIKENAWKKELSVDYIAGYSDHVHCLFTLSKNLSIDKAIQLIKDEPAKWANQRKLVKPKLAWEEEYVAISVSESKFDELLDYLKKQEEYHSEISFTQEFNSLLKDNYFVLPTEGE